MSFSVGILRFALRRGGIAMACALLFAGASYGQAEAEPTLSPGEGVRSTEAAVPPSWYEVEVPFGFHLDPLTGVVANQRRGAGGPTIVLDEHGLSGEVELQQLGAATLELEEGGRRKVVLEDGEALDVLPDETGAEALLRIGEASPVSPGAWGYLRVLDRLSNSLVLEVALAPENTTTLEREPGEVTVARHPGGLELSWYPSAEGPWRVERAVVRGRTPSDKSFTVLDTVDEARFVDEDLERELLYEYRVTRLTKDGSPAPWGATGRGVFQGLAGGESVPVLRGTELSLLTGDVLGARVDLVIDYVTADAVQLSPGEGRSLRLLLPDEAAVWELPDPGRGGYVAPRRMAQVGSSLAVALPEGILARVTVERGDATAPRLRCQVDLAGGRVFPQPPAEPEVRFTPEGVAFDFTGHGTGGGGASKASHAFGTKTKPPITPVELPDDASVVVEREDELGSEIFVEVLEGDAGERVVLDPVGGPPRIVRYRFKSRSPVGRTSPAGEAVRVLLVDQGDEARVEGLIADAVRDLGDADFRRRDAARAVLELLETRALDALGRALLSDDPEVASSAREILSQLAPEETAGESAVSVALVLRARAVSTGLEDEPPIEGLLAESPIARAIALLRRLGQDGRAPEEASDLEAWRALIAEADPDAGVRLVAQHWHSLASEPWRPVMGRLIDLPEPDSVPRAESIARAREELVGVQTVDEVVDVVLRLLPGLDTLQELLLLSLLAELEGRGPESVLELDELDRIHLALALLEQHETTDSVVFLEAADRLFRDPAVLALAWRSFAERRFDPPALGERRVERLPVADGAAFDARLRELAEEGAEDVDLVLPAGVYERPDTSNRRALSIPGLRILADGDVVLRGTLSIAGVDDVVLAGLALEGRTRAALMLNGATVVLEDCLLSGGNTIISGSESIVGLSRCELVAANPNTPATGVRLSGTSLVLARDTSFDSAGSAMQGTRSGLFERCAIDAGRRNGIDGTRGGALVLVDTLIESDASCLSNIERGVLDGALLLSPTRAVAAFRPEVAVCTEHLMVRGADGELARGEQLDECPLGRTRYR